MAHLSLERPSVLNALLVPLVPFVVVSLLAPLYSNETNSDWLWAWQAVVLWPIGGLLMSLPVLVARQIIERQLRTIALVAIAVLGVVSAVAVAREEHSTAGLHYLYVLIGGPIASTALLALDYLRVNRRMSGRSQS